MNLKNIIFNKDIVKEKIKQLRLTKWCYSECDICEYRKYFLFEGIDIFHDEGCTCIDQETMRQKYIPSSCQAIVDVFEGLNIDEKEKAIKYWQI